MARNFLQRGWHYLAFFSQKINKMMILESQTQKYPNKQEQNLSNE